MIAKIIKVILIFATYHTHMDFHNSFGSQVLKYWVENGPPMDAADRA